MGNVPSAAAAEVAANGGRRLRRTKSNGSKNRRDEHHLSIDDSDDDDISVMSSASHQRNIQPTPNFISSSLSAINNVADVVTVTSTDEDDSDEDIGEKTNKGVNGIAASFDITNNSNNNRAGIVTGSNDNNQCVSTTPLRKGDDDENDFNNNNTEFYHVYFDDGDGSGGQGQPPESSNSSTYLQDGSTLVALAENRSDSVDATREDNISHPSPKQTQISLAAIGRHVLGPPAAAAATTTATVADPVTEHITQVSSQVEGPFARQVSQEDDITGATFVSGTINKDVMEEKQEDASNQKDDASSVVRQRPSYSRVAGDDGPATKRTRLTSEPVNKPSSTDGMVDEFDFTPAEKVAMPMAASYFKLSYQRGRVSLNPDTDDEDEEFDEEPDSEDSSDEENDYDSEDERVRAAADLTSEANGVYTGTVFDRMIRRCERTLGSIDCIEDGSSVRAANQRVNNSDSTRQRKAQYGRLLPYANKKVMTILGVNKDDIFLDIGHGIGNTCFYCSYCIGCDSRGLELVENRYKISQLFQEQLEIINRSSENKRVGHVDLRRGSLDDPKFRDFQTQGVSRIYFNNFNEVFSGRSGVVSGLQPDQVVCGLFSRLQPGSVLVSFHPLPLGPDRRRTNELRRKNNLEESDDASFFKEEKVALGKMKDCVKWLTYTNSEDTIMVYRYTRLRQSDGDGNSPAVFLCVNPKCDFARNNIKIPAPDTDEGDRCTVRTHCYCGHSAHVTRQERPAVRRYAAQG